MRKYFRIFTPISLSLIFLLSAVYFAQGQEGILVPLEGATEVPAKDVTEIPTIDTTETVPRATISSFTLDESIISTSRLSDYNPTLFVTASFTGENIDGWDLVLNCPLPSTLEGVVERIDLIQFGGEGVRSPSKALQAGEAVWGDVCNLRQDIAPSATAEPQRFMYLIINPYTTTQSVTLTLVAKTWDSSNRAYVEGETQDKVVIVQPTFPTP